MCKYELSYLLSIHNKNKINKAHPLKRIVIFNDTYSGIAGKNTYFL